MSEFGTVITQTPIASAWANAIIDHAFEKPCAFIVRKNGSNYEAIYGSGSNQAGKIYGTPNSDLATVLNGVLTSGLTAGRTSQEKVVVKVGAETGVDQITVPSYTILELQGKLTAKANLDKHFIVNSDTVAGNTDITLYGGFYDANRANQTACMNCIHMEKVLRPTVQNCIIHGGFREVAILNTYGEGISFVDSDWGTIFNNYCYDAWYDNIKVRGESTHINVQNNRCVNSYNANGIQISTTGTSWIDVGGNTILCDDSTGSLVFMGITLHSPDHVHIHDNMIKVNHDAGNRYGIRILDDTTDTQIDNNTIYFYDTGSAGIHCQTVTAGWPLRNSIHDNFIYFGDTGAQGVYIENGDENEVYHNSIHGSGAETGVQIGATNTTDNLIGYNRMRNVATKITNAGTTTRMLSPQEWASGTTAVLSTVNTEYFTPTGMGTTDTNIAYRAIIMPESCYASGLYMYLSTAPTGAGVTRALTLMVDGAASTLTCTCTNLETTAEDVAHWVAINRGQLVTLRDVPTNAPVAALIRAGFRTIPVGY